MRKYKIVRFRKDGKSEVVANGLTLEEAKAHCNDPKTKGEDWFDGFLFVEDTKCIHGANADSCYDTNK